MKGYDLKLPTWGPYNKFYMGAAHVADKEQGLRCDLNLFPGFFRKSIMLPKDNVDCGVKIMASSTDLSHYVYRYELQWKDEIYVDADFVSENDTLKVVCNFVNNTEHPESLSMNALLSMHSGSQYRKEWKGMEIRKDEHVRWVDAIDYSAISLKQDIAYDGLLLGERRSKSYVSGSCLSSAFFGTEGDFVKYEFERIETDEFYIRYRGQGNLTLQTKEHRYDVSLPKQDSVTTYKIDIMQENLSELVIYPHDAQIEIDGFLLGGNADFFEEKNVFVPEVNGDEHEFEIKFGDYTYQVVSDAEYSVIRRLRTDAPCTLLSNQVHNHVSKVLGKGDREYIDLFIRPIFLNPHSSRRVTLTIRASQGETYHSNHQLYVPKYNAEGEKYILSQKIMSAVTLTNVVWPVYCKRGFIRHNTPGGNWDSLYTWDSGFIGMGLAQMDIQRAKECLNTYLTDINDKHSPYIFHGTPLPTQILLYAEIYVKKGDKEFLREFYPYVKQQYRYFADMRKRDKIQETGLFSLWHVFYNSGGWDDYPTQEYVHEHGLEGQVCPVINTAFTILCGKILKQIAEEIGEDITEYNEDIAFYSNAIQTYAWDKQSGYYGYVSYDEKPSILQIGGVNGNMGMDGVYPYIAGVSNEEQSEAIVQNIKDGLMTDVGVSVVDTRAPYFREDGYWNGSVWMPHQWILWKALLDHGEIDLAMEIATKALDVWEKEVSITYNCYEHFVISNGRGAGFHHFSGLSTPVLMWFAALYRPYTVTTGFMSIVRNVKRDEATYSFEVKLDGANPYILLCLEEGKEYTFVTSGKVRKVNRATFAISNFKDKEEKVSITW